MVTAAWPISVPSPLEELLTPQSLTSCQVCILAQPFLLLLCLPCSCSIVVRASVGLIQRPDSFRPSPPLLSRRTSQFQILIVNSGHLYRALSSHSQSLHILSILHSPLLCHASALISARLRRDRGLPPNTRWVMPGGCHQGICRNLHTCAHPTHACT